MRWLAYCEAGVIYQHLQKRLAESASPVIRFEVSNGFFVETNWRSASLRQVKKAVLVCMFDTLESSRHSPVFQAIAQDFPTIADFILAAKRSHHSDLAKMLQMAEATLMIDLVGEMLIDQYPDEPVQPIHDALLVRNDFTGVAKDLIEAAFKRFGLNPHVKTEACGGQMNGNFAEPVVWSPDTVWGPDTTAGWPVGRSNVGASNKRDVLRN